MTSTFGSDSLDILVHNAATKEGCGRTVDGHSIVTQVNYLSPFLLTRLLLPTLRKDSRVVHLTCDAALQQPDWCVISESLLAFDRQGALPPCCRLAG
eukprot:SAG11_NODE_172_length_13574_cov_14.732690_13_plen_97_part_00